MGVFKVYKLKKVQSLVLRSIFQTLKEQFSDKCSFVNLTLKTLMSVKVHTFELEQSLVPYSLANNWVEIT